MIGRTFKQLTELYLQYNNVGSEGVLAVAGDIPTLETLNITSNNLGEDSVEFLIERLKHIKDLYLAGNNFQAPSLSRIRSSMENVYVES